MLRARDVWEEQEQRRGNRMAAMGPVMAKLQAQIRQQAIHNANAPYIVFEVPNYVFGYPLYQMSEAVQFLTAELSKAGYWVWTLPENCLFISWIKPVKTKDLGKPILATNYRPQVYDPASLAFMTRNTNETR